MIRTVLMLIVFWAGLVCFLAAQDEPQQPENFKDYSCLTQHYDAQAKAWKPGTYFVLVSADWCVPCKGLKANLALYKHIPVYLVDLDREKTLAKKIMQTHRTVPCLVRYAIGPAGNHRTVYRYGSDLDAFLATSVLVHPEHPEKQSGKR